MADVTQRGLFDAESTPQAANAAAGARIAGLVCVPDFIGPAFQEQLLLRIDAEPWMTELKRRVQHYGYRYDYRTRSVDHSMRLGELPVWSIDVAAQLQERGLVARPPDQLIVNEYEPGQGINNHIDCEPCFDGNVVSLSLGSACVMNFTHRTSGDVVGVLLEAGSLVVLTGEARYDWMHGIAARKSDTFAGRTFHRARRVSMTFRKVVLSNVTSL